MFGGGKPSISVLELFGRCRKSLKASCKLTASHQQDAVAMSVKIEILSQDGKVSVEYLIFFII